MRFYKYKYQTVENIITRNYMVNNFGNNDGKELGKNVKELNVNPIRLKSSIIDQNENNKAIDFGIALDFDAKSMKIISDVNNLPTADGNSFSEDNDESEGDDDGSEENTTAGNVTFGNNIDSDIDINENIGNNEGQVVGAIFGHEVVDTIKD